jgi:hypothetical protein
VPRGSLVAVHTDTRTSALAKTERLRAIVVAPAARPSCSTEIASRRRCCAAPLAPATGLCVERPARRERAALARCRRSIQLNQKRTVCRASFPRLPLSCSQAPRLGRPSGVASRWLRQPRPGIHSQGFRAYKEDGGRAGNGIGRAPPAHAAIPGDRPADESRFRAFGARDLV